MHEITVYSSGDNEHHIWTCSCRSEARDCGERISYPSVEKALLRASEHLRRTIHRVPLKPGERFIDYGSSGSLWVGLTNWGRNLKVAPTKHDMKIYKMFRHRT